MEKEEITSKDLLLVLLYSPVSETRYNEPVLGRTKLIKMVFLFEKEIYENFFKKEIQIEIYQFQPYLFGPFSSELFRDLNFFLSIGFIEKEETLIPISSAEIYEEEIQLEEDDFNSEDRESVELKYFLSARGRKYVEEKIWHKFTDTQKSKLMEFKIKITTISLDSLLKYVYNKYPETTTKSKILHKYNLEDKD